jgi:hypothetical protein
MLDKFARCNVSCSGKCCERLFSPFIDVLTYNSYCDLSLGLSVKSRTLPRSYPPNSQGKWDFENNRIVYDELFCEREIFIFSKYLYSQFGLNMKYELIANGLDNAESCIEEAESDEKEIYNFSILSNYNLDFNVVGIFYEQDSYLSDRFVSSLPVIEKSSNRF